MKSKLTIYLVVFLAFSSLVLAANPLELLFEPFQGVGFGDFYQANYAFIDGIIYLLIFLGLARFVFSSLYKDKQSSKAITVGVGLALSFAAVFFELRTGFMLGQLGPFALLVVLLVFLILIFELIKSISNNDNSLAVSVAVIVGYGLLRSAFLPVYEWLSAVPLVRALLHILLLISVIIVIIKMFSMFKSNKSGEDSSTDSGNGKTETSRDNADSSDSTPSGSTNSETPDTPGTTSGGTGQGSPKVTIKSPVHNKPVNLGDDFKPEIVVSGGKPPYVLDVYLDGTHLDHDSTDGTYKKDFGKIAPPLFPAIKEYAFVAQAVDSNGKMGNNGAKFKVNPSRFSVSFEEPSTQTKRSFSKDQNIEAVIKIKGGKPPYSALLFLNGDINNTDCIVAGVKDFKPNNEGKARITIKKDNKNFLKHRKIGEDNNLFVLLYDSSEPNLTAKDGTKFTISEKGKQFKLIIHEPDPSKVNNVMIANPIKIVGKVFNGEKPYRVVITNLDNKQIVFEEKNWNLDKIKISLPTPQMFKEAGKEKLNIYVSDKNGQHDEVQLDFGIIATHYLGIQIWDPIKKEFIENEKEYLNFLFELSYPDRPFELKWRVWNREYDSNSPFEAKIISGNFEYSHDYTGKIGRLKINPGSELFRNIIRTRQAKISIHESVYLRDGAKNVFFKIKSQDKSETGNRTANNLEKSSGNDKLFLPHSARNPSELVSDLEDLEKKIGEDSDYLQKVPNEVRTNDNNWNNLLNMHSKVVGLLPDIKKLEEQLSLPGPKDVKSIDQEVQRIVKLYNNFAKMLEIFRQRNGKKPSPPIQLSGPTKKSWVVKMEKELKNISGKRLKDLRVESDGSFAAQYVKGPSRLGLTKKLDNSEKALKRIVSLVGPFENEIDHRSLNLLDKYYKSFEDKLKALKNPLFKETIIHLCEKIGVNPSKGNPIHNAIKNDAINSEQDQIKKNNMINLKKYVRYLYANYVVLFRALYYFRQTAKQILDEQKNK